MNRCVINGVEINVPSGSNVSVIGDVIYVNGKPYDGKEGNASGIVKIEIQGEPLNVRTDRGDIEVHGNVQGKVDAGGSVTCSNVGKDVDAGGSVNCDAVNGSIDAGGSVNCGSVGGDIDAGGSVRHR
jgi:hypothetical protein